MPRRGRPSKSFQIDQHYLTWLKTEANRRGTSQGAVLRELIAHAMVIQGREPKP